MRQGHREGLCETVSLKQNSLPGTKAKPSRFSCINQQFYWFRLEWTSQFKSSKHVLWILIVHKRWNSNALATWCEELTHLKRPWYWEGLRAGGEGDDRGWDGWMASLTRWAWVWVNSRSWWWTGSWCAAIHGVTKSQTRLSDWTELNWTEPLQYSCLKNPMDRGAWWATVHGVTESDMTD